jgi:hypothetical protein
MEDYFNFPPFDRIVRESKPQTSASSTNQPTIELMSIGPGDGKTHLLYQLCALAVLPRSMNGKQECVVIIDMDGQFAIPKLAAQIQLLLHHQSIESMQDLSEQRLGAELISTLKHVHIFRPQNLGSTIATLDSLPTYLFNQNRHYSFDREVAFIALDSASAFYWQDRSEVENAAFLAKTQASRATSNQTSDYFNLATALKRASKAFDCPTIFTTWYLGPQQKARDGMVTRAFRPQIRPLQASLRLVVHRVPVRKFPAGLSLDEALREAADRQKAVGEGRFECFVNEWSSDERSLREPGSGGFDFRIVGDGLVVQEDEETSHGRG